MARTFTVVNLAAAPAAVASGGTTVWCAAGNRLRSFGPAGAPDRDVPAPPGLQGIAAAGGMLVASLAVGVVAWLDPASGAETHRATVPGSPMLIAGGGGIWAVDRASARAWWLAAPGTLGPPLDLGDVDRAAADVDGQRLWWTSRRDTRLRSATRSGSGEVEIGYAAPDRGGMAVCAGSIWIGVDAGLVRVGTWDGKRGPIVSAPSRTPQFLDCADGVLVGGSGGRDLFVLDPAIDADARGLDAGFEGRLSFLVGARDHVWAFPHGAAEARVVRVRPA